MKEEQKKGSPTTVLTIRPYSGLSGDMFMAGLLRITETDETELNKILCSILPQLDGSVKMGERQINRIGGWHAEVSLPHEHEHRTLGDIEAIIAKSGLSEPAKKLAYETFEILAKAEADVHGKDIQDVHFHEVGALDSILDICVTSELFARLSPDGLVVGPLPIADGAISCAHGILPSPAPAVLKMLDGAQVRPFCGSGETITPTAIALLHSFNATFGLWPSMVVQKHALVYGTTTFPDVPNGALFVMGTSL